MNMDQVIRIQVEIMNGATWETRSSEIPDTEEARGVWDRMTADLAKGRARGWIPEIPNEIPL